MANRKDNKGRVLKDGERQRANGSYEFRWKENGKRKSVYAPTLKKLREKESAIQRDTLDGIQTDGRTLTLNDMYERWLPLKTSLSEGTYMNYKFMYEYYVKDNFGKKKIADIKSTDIQRLYIALHEDCLAYSTLDNLHRVLQQIFNQAVKDDYIRKNPCAGIMKDLKQSADYKKNKVIALKPHQRDAFMNFVANSDRYKHWHPIFTILLYTGMRIGEFTALRPEDIDFDNGYITITHSLSYRKNKEGKCVYTYGDTKTESSKRCLPMLPNVKQAFLDIMKRQADKNLKCRVSVNGFDDFITLNRLGRPLYQGLVNSAIKGILEQYCEEVEKPAKEKGEEFIVIPKFSCHSFRHTFATNFYASTKDVKALQAILGHANFEITMDIYVDLFKDDIDDAFDDFGEKQNIK